MRKNKVKQMMAEGKPVVNGWLQIPSTVSAEVMAHQGWDSLTVDMQHGLVDYTNALPMLQTISSTDVTPLARVNWNEPGQIMKILDAGCYGIICPMVSNKEEAERFVQACMYPPRGYRSFGPVRGLIYGGADYADHANDEILKLAMIETKESLDKLDEIMSTEGVDGIYIGPIRKLKNTLFSAHRAGALEEAFYNMGEIVLKDMKLVLKNMPPKFCKRAQRKTVKLLASKPVAIN
ncbi:aldolase/citrate lyase family protein [Candidatus Pelagibacter sp.]|nr:aldolase/citrate lyase family protein [Candidatus Pelagibacter sp.]